MKSKPVSNYASPKYPTRLEIAACPGLLLRHQPPAWRQWPELTGTIGLFLLADATRLAAADGPPADGQAPAPAQAKAVAIVSPLFEHGDGRGSTGCIVMTPPVFLSEEEALKVIREEMAAKGVQLAANPTPLAGVIDATRWKPGRGFGKEPFHADAADPKKQVFVEFLGEQDAMPWDMERDRDEGKFTMSTSRSYDLPKTAEFVAAKVRKHATDKVYFGTFYDPMAGKLSSRKQIDAQLQASQNKLSEKAAAELDHAKVESRHLLRLQVQDFLEWLKAQGVI